MTASTVLVVEDEQLVARGIRQALRTLGYHVPKCVGTAEQAIQSAGELKPRLVLMDIELGGEMDGVEAAAQIRRRFDIPVVYLTSSSDEETRGRAAQTRPYGYLVKPFDTRELGAAVEIALQRYDLERRIDAKQSWLTATLESIRDAVLGADADGVVLFMNRMAERITGWRREEAAGKPMEDVFRLVDAAGAPLEDPAFSVLDRARGGDTQEVTIETRTGEHLRIETTASAIMDRRGEVLGEVVVFRQAHESELERRPVRSEERVSLPATGPGMGHEINNALAYVISNIGFSLEGVREVLLRLQGLELPKGHRSTLGSTVSLLRDVTDALDDANEGADRVRRTVRDRASELQELLSSTPPATRRTPSSIAPETDPDPERNRARMLVIDDDRAVAAAMARLLGLQHEVAIATDPKDALARILQGEEFDVVFCDLTAPSTSAIEFYESLATALPALAARVVFMTGGVFSDEAGAFLGRVTNASLTKPFTLESVERVVARWIPSAVRRRDRS